jgi:hypothetical protein
MVLCDLLFLHPLTKQKQNNNTMNRNFHEILTDDATAESFGKEIAQALRLKPVKGVFGTMYNTTWGNKTNKGLARILHTILTSPTPE